MPARQAPRRDALHALHVQDYDSHDLEFYQLLDYTDDVDLRRKLTVWEEFYNVHRPHGGLEDRTPCKVLREKMAS